MLAEERPGHPYRVPADYFESIAGNVITKVSETIMPTSRQMPMSIPGGYFDGLADSILGKIKASETNEAGDPQSELLSSIGKHMPFSVPAGYFEKLEQDIASVYWNEAAPTVLTVINRKNPFMVPDGYFQQFPSQVARKIRPVKKEAAVYPIDFVKKVYRYAAAAIIIGIISVAGLMYWKNDPSPSAVAGNSPVDINSISIDELQNYVSGQELIETENLFIATNNDLDAGDLKEFLDDMPEETLQKYVQEYAQPNTN